jgi:hypothetical protein
MEGIMTNIVWERIASATGIVFFVSIVASFITFTPRSEPFGLDAPAETIASFYRENQSSIALGVFLFALGFGFFIWFLGSLRRTVVFAEGTGDRLASLTFGAGLLTALMFLLSSVGYAAIVAEPAFSDETIRQFHLFAATGIQLEVMSTLTRAIMIGAAGLASVRFSAFPKWLGWFSLVVALLSFLGLFRILFGHRGVGGDIADLMWVAALAAFPLWVLLTSIVLTVRPEGMRASEGAPIL